MSSLYVKDGKLWIRYKNETGKWVGRSTPFRPGQEAEAKVELKRREAQVAANKAVADATGIAPGTKMTVAQYAKKWVKDRELLKLASHEDDAARLDHGRDEERRKTGNGRQDER